MSKREEGAPTDSDSGVGVRSGPRNRPRPAGSYEEAKTFIQDAVASDAPPSQDLIAMNERLNAWEQYLGVGLVASFPVMLRLPISNVCNARCLFCAYEPSRVRGSLVTVEDFCRADWLKFVRSFSPTAGLTEPLAHPQIARILAEVRRQAPFITMTMTTNASLLNDAAIDAVAGHMKWMTVSLNAARKETYEHVMALRWDTTMRNLRRLEEVKRERGTDRPSVTASVVVHRHIIDELAEMPALLRSVGIRKVRLLIMKLPNPVTQRKLYDMSDHVSVDPDRTNRALREFQRECASHEVDHLGVIPFVPERAVLETLHG